MKDQFITGNVSVSGMTIPEVSTQLRFKDHLGAMMVRWGFNRDNYRVNPGLYAAGNPGADSEVLVTSNYKLTFDHLRKSIQGINAWILVLDTKGINVWCAAGKGTFSTKELVNRINAAGLEKIVTHKRLILPQLGATGVAAHKVREQTGFNVHYGPVLSADIKKFIADGYRADRDMRKVKFRFTDRLKLIPNDFMYGKFYLLAAMLIMVLCSGLSSNGLDFKSLQSEAFPVMLRILLAYMAGIVFTPMFLPYIPGRHFSLKGFVTGTLVFLAFLVTGSLAGNNIEKVSWFLIIVAIASFMAMNFTGTSTFTSLSGVKKEMKLFLPLQIGFVGTGLILNIIGKYI